MDCQKNWTMGCSFLSPALKHLCLIEYSVMMEMLYNIKHLKYG